jgi:Cu+-exporting ATPase
MEKKIDLQIQGMTCASCVNRIERVLNKKSGILNSSVNLATEKARITFDDQSISIQDIIRTISNAGYEASLDTKKEDTSTYNKKIVLISALLSLPLFAPMLTMLFGWEWQLNPWWQFLLATPVQFFIGSKFYKSAWLALKNRSGNMDLLVVLGTSAAYFLSLYLLIKNFGKPHFEHAHLYFESSAVVITLVLLGKYLETEAKRQTTAAIRALEKIIPDKVRILENNQEIEIPLSELKKNHLVLVKAGERISVDGIISWGNSHVNESLLTGESLPVEKNVNDKVIGGSINGEGPLKIRVTALGAETMLARIIRLVEDAQAKKAPIQKLVDKVSAWFVPIVILIATGTFILTYLFQGDFEKAIIHSVAVLVIACPCALGLATPTSLMVGTGVAAKAGILIRDAESLEVAHSINLVAFDKTGTLTKGEPELTYLKSYRLDHNQALNITGSLQLNSEHPLARAVLKKISQQNEVLLPAESVKILTGRGIQGRLNDKSYLFGSKRLLLNNDQNIFQIIKEREQEGETVSVLINEESNLVEAILGFKDNLKPHSKKTIEKLQEANIKTIMITGDNIGAASAIGNELGIDQIIAEVLPEDKAKIIADLKKQGFKVAMVGDGINDAPALALADVSMAMSSGTDVAMQTSGITLMRGEPLLIPDAISISRKTYAKIKQNLFWAFIYNVIGIPLAALGYLSPVIAGSAMALSSFSVVTNSLFLRRWKSTLQG